MPARSYFEGPTPRILAHRGLATAAPENSLAAIAAALDAGADLIETDVRATADGVAVLLHDPGLGRITSVDVPVRSLTLAEVRAIGPVGAQICTLVEALRTFPSAGFNIDVKSRSAVGAVARALHETGALDRVLVTSFNRRRRVRTLARAGDAAASASATEALTALLAARTGLRVLLRRVVRDLDAVQIPSRIRGFEVATPRLIRAFQRAGVEVHVWTVNDRVDMRRLIAAGVDGIVTDRCDVLAEELGRRP